MAQYITKIRTEDGDKQIDYKSLANLPTIDETLKVHGEPADARATGNAIDDLHKKFSNKLDSSVNELNTSISNLQDLVGEIPVQEAIQQLADSTALGLSKKAETSSYTGAFAVDNWVRESSYYTQSITVNGILINDTPLIDVDLSNVSDYLSVIENWMLVGRVTAPADNTIVGYCYEDKPEVDIPIVLKVIR